MKARPRRGAALLLVLWAVGVICIAVVGLTALTQEAIQNETQLQHLDRARHLAESGLAILECPGVQNGDPVLTQTMPGGGRFTARSTGECGRLQINALLQRGDRSVLQRLFSGWGLNSVEADTVIDCLLDWVHPLAGRRLNGAGMDAYRAARLPYGPTGTDFISLDQMAQVLHFDFVTRRKSDWRDFFTVWTDGTLDVNSASADVLAAVTQAPRSKAVDMVNYLAGPDGMSNTSDDIRFATLDQARLFLGVPPEIWNALVVPVSLESAVVRLESTGQSGPIEVSASLVLNQATSPFAVLERRER